MSVTRAMITTAEVEKLRSARSGAPDVLSLYLPVPADPAGLRAVPARAAGLIDAAVAASDRSGAAGSLSGADRDDVGRLVEEGVPEWAGHTAAIFACRRLGLLEAMPLPGRLPGRAVLDVRPHVRPLLTVLQRCPGYLIAIADRRHCWLLSVNGDQVETLARLGEPAAGRGSGGGHDGTARRIERRAGQAAGRHYGSLAAILEDRQVSGDYRPLVAVGQQGALQRLLDALPPAVAAAVAGSCVTDARTLTRAWSRELADPVIGDWIARREQRLAAEVRDAAAAGRAASGLAASLAAVNAAAADLLIIPDEGLVPGHVCGRCGVLTVTGDDCPDWGTAARPVPDLLEEMAARVLDDGGQVVAVSPPLGVAARIRCPAAWG